jgi:uncharacterized membrane protein HdeD (DUF308 family)
MVLAGFACVSHGLLSMLAIPIDGTAWVRRLLSGVIGISTGLVILQNPVASTQVLTSALAIIVGICALLLGVSVPFAAHKGNGWVDAFFGAMSGVIGLLMVFIPAGGGRARVFGAISLVAGLLMILNSALVGEFLVWLVGLLLGIVGGIGILMALSKRQSRNSATANPVPIRGHLMRRLVKRSHNWETTPWRS